MKSSKLLMHFACCEDELVIGVASFCSSATILVYSVSSFSTSAKI